MLICSAVFNFGNIWTVVSQAHLAMGIVQTRMPEWVAMHYPCTARLKMFILLCLFFMYDLHEKSHKAIKLEQYIAIYMS